LLLQIVTIEVIGADIKFNMLKPNTPGKIHGPIAIARTVNLYFESATAEMVFCGLNKNE